MKITRFDLLFAGAKVDNFLTMPELRLLVLQAESRVGPYIDYYIFKASDDPAKEGEMPDEEVFDDVVTKVRLHEYMGLIATTPQSIKNYILSELKWQGFIPEDREIVTIRHSDDTPHIVTMITKELYDDILLYQTLFDGNFHTPETQVYLCKEMGYEWGIQQWLGYTAEEQASIEHINKADYDKWVELKARRPEMSNTVFEFIGRFKDKDELMCRRYAVKMGVPNQLQLLTNVNKITREHIQGLIGDELLDLAIRFNVSYNKSEHTISDLRDAIYGKVIESNS